MTLQEQYDRAARGIETARTGLRRGGNDAMIDHWAYRLVFWKDEASRLRKIHEQGRQPGETLGDQYGLTEQGSD